MENAGSEPVQSPCIGVCTLDGAGAVCLGCGRLIGEIAQWSSASEARRRQIFEAARQRLAGAAQSLIGRPSSS
ncbi:MAG: DUF1289 domain-containing protein [Panacagrimonas sp.]